MQSMAPLLDLGSHSFQVSSSVNKYGFALSAVRFSAFWVSRPSWPDLLERLASAKGNGLLSAYASTFFLTLTNPTTILSFAGIFAGLGVGSASGNYVSAGFLVLGVFIGSALWWLILSSIVGSFGRKTSSQKLRWINRISGIIITIFGLIALLSLKR